MVYPTLLAVVGDVAAGLSLLSSLVVAVRM